MRMKTKRVSMYGMALVTAFFASSTIIASAATPTVSNVTAKQRDSGLSGLSVAYYDIASSGYSTWTQSEAAMTNYFAGLTPTLETNTGDWGDRLSSGMADYEDQKSQMLSVGMTGLDDEEACRFHGKYADETCDNFSVLIKGYLTIDIPGEYAFAVLADDKLVLYIDGSRVCSASWNSVAQGSLSLESGRHRIAMAFSENSGRQGFNVQWKKPGDASYSPLPQSVLSFEAPEVTASGTWLGYNATPSSWSASGNNALRGLTGVFSGTRYNESGRVSSSDPISRLTDGVVNPTGATYGNTFAIKSGTLTWTLPSAVDVYKLRINTHWENGGRDGVNLTSVEYQQSGDASWLTLPNSAVSHGLNDNNTSGDLEFVYENPLETVFATSVVAVRFNLGNQDNNGTGFTEFEVVGNTASGNGGGSTSGDIGDGDNQEPSNEGPKITNVTAKQRYPWNGMVDITCTVSGISGTTDDFKFSMAAVNSDDAHNISRFWIVRNGTNSTDRTVHTNGTYHLVWDSKVNFNNQVCSNMVMRVNLAVIHDKVQLWANGPYWATTNIGAEEPYESGYYFWWGDTIGYKRVNDVWMASDGSSSNFSFASGNTPTDGKSVATLQSEGWITADGVLVPEHDAAHVHWGGAWRMPTKEELDDLDSKCDWTWTAMNGVNGYVVRGRGDYVTISIFLPAAGYVYGSSLRNSGSNGLYWSSVPYSDYYYGAYDLYFYSGSHYTSHSGNRNYGFPVRPVQGFIKKRTK